jgi:hypothetical protein
LDQHASTSLKVESHRREAMVTRVLPRLSGADRWGPGKPRTDRGIPTRIERGLGLLENFGRSTTPDQHATYLIAAVAEGVFMNERISALGNLAIPGYPAALLVQATARTMRALPESAAHWAGVDVEVSPYRRGSAAWLAVAAKLRSQVDGVPNSSRVALDTLVLGCELLAATTDLRSLAFELAGGLEFGEIVRLARAKLDTGWLQEAVGLEVTLVNQQKESFPVASLEAETSRLICNFRDIILGQRAALNTLRDQVTPAGWVVLVAILLQIVEVENPNSELRPSLWPMTIVREALANGALSSLLGFASTASSAIGDSETWPWDGFTELEARRPTTLAKCLRDATDSANITVDLDNSWFNPRTAEKSAGREIMRLGDGSSISLADWQLDIAHIVGEKGSATESRIRDGRLQFIYTIAKVGDRVLGMHMTSRELAAAAFGRREESSRNPKDVSLQNSELQSFDSGKPDTIAVAIVLEPAHALSVDAKVVEPEAAVQREEELVSRDDKKHSIEFTEVLKKQSKAWKERAAEKGPQIQRVALVQWDVSETYSAPSVGTEGLLTENHQAATAADIAAGGAFLSTTELRRRAILTSVLSACADFGVDGLVLPEYSLRPETINWLSRKLRQVASPITVWCGTFRVPDGTQLDKDFSPDSTQPFYQAEFEEPPAGRSRYEFHSSLLTCLQVRQIDGKLLIASAVRPKRYPSAAIGERIRPPIDVPWGPLLQDTKDPFDLGTYSLELICSEMFPHASGANFVGVIEENQALGGRYGNNRGADTPFKYLTRDVYEFAKWTSYRNPGVLDGDIDSSLSRGARLQRTLIILPAMTSRSADYHVFGQNQYLAAGLVTVFCNAYQKPFGCGQSCFIGLDGWLETEPPSSPYGTVAPGIFQVGGVHTGPLGKRESAMVIADLDLLRTADQKPRPHYQARSLKLVAHLPLIFHTESGEGVSASAYPNKQRRTRSRVIGNDDAASTFVAAAAGIHDALNRENTWRGNGGALGAGSIASLAYTAAIESTNRALLSLEDFADDSQWLAKRRAAFNVDRYERPSAQPLPALIDWIYVDDRWSLSQTNDGDGKEYDINAYRSDEPYIVVGKTLTEPKRDPS